MREPCETGQTRLTSEAPRAELRETQQATRTSLQELGKALDAALVAASRQVTPVVSVDPASPFLEAVGAQG